jgi:prepilin-type N-terminal cleavage/methylation domain-containing protein
MARADERGVTLLELLVALLLLAIALIGLAASFPLAMYGVTLGGYETTATLLAQEVVERAKGRPYPDVPGFATGGTACSTTTGTYVDLGSATPPFPGFSRCVSVQTATPTPTTTTLTVIVRYQSGGGEPVHTRLATVLGD